MGIPESQLETWGNRSQTDTAINAHETIRAAVRNRPLPIAGVRFEDYLQGSYRNHTNTVQDHDVDIVLELTSSFWYEDTALNAEQKARLRAAIAPATYSLSAFRDEILCTLYGAFGAAVDPGNKAIAVAGQAGVRRDADVIVCQTYRHYHRFDGDPSRGYTRGICFRDQRDGRLIVNYPQQHYDNGVAKQEVTREWFKRTVRIFKNARNHLIRNGAIADGSASSYFLQGLLYNVPPEEFGGGWRLNFSDVLRWLSAQAVTPRCEQEFTCQNGLIKLFGPSPEQWDICDARRFLVELHRLDANWR